MDNVKLSEYVDNQEAEWKLSRRNIYSQIIEKLNDKLGINLYEKYNKSEPEKLFSYLRIWLLVNYNKELISVINEIGIEIKLFYLGMINSFILTVTREKENMYFLRDILIKAGIITSFTVDKDDTFIITSSYVETPIKFQKATKVFNDMKIQTFLKKEDIVSDCHQSALFLINEYRDFTAITATCKKDFGQLYYHSFALDNDGNIIDLTGNLVMSKDTYYKLYGVTEINKLTIEQYEKVNTESKNYDESGTLMDLLRIAVYNQIKNNNIE